MKVDLDNPFGRTREEDAAQAEFAKFLLGNGYSPPAHEKSAIYFDLFFPDGQDDDDEMELPPSP